MKVITSLIFLCLISFTAWAKTEMNDHHYTISGNTCEELKQQMRLFAPRPNEAIYEGSTEWQSAPDWKFEREGERWKIGSAEFNLSMKYYLPKWTNRNQGEAGLQKEWDRLLTGLKVHQQGHQDLGMRAAAAIEKAALELPSAESREAISKKADSVAKNILAQYSEKERLYDHQTQYGSTQGAYLCQ